MDMILSPLISAISGLIGVILGGLLSYSLEKKRWEREDAKRFDLERRQAYAKFFRVVNDLGDARSDFSTDGKVPRHLQTEFVNSLTEIELLASPAVCKATTLFAEVVSESIFNRNSKVPIDQWGLRREHLLEAIHSEMGVDHSSMLSSLHSVDDGAA